MKPLISLLFCFVMITLHSDAQSITGVWRGKLTRGIKNYNLELKLVRNGDSLTGTSYYYHSPSNYSRFKVKGYFDVSGDVVWWDRELIESKGGKVSSPNTSPFRFAADFNCPGNDIMKLDGTADKSGDDSKDHEVHLSKVDDPYFKDEWDEVIGDFPYYASVPDYIDSLDRGYAVPKPAQPVAKAAPPVVEKNISPAADKPAPPPADEAGKTAVTEKPAPASIEQQPVKKSVEKSTAPPIAFTPKTEIPASIRAPKTIEEKYIERKKILVTEIPVMGDSIKLNFYDNAQVDGDSISLFLNGKLIHQHILLKATPFEIGIAVADLEADNELIMVAENLGSIPPNTSLMIVWVNGVRHEARLESTENSSAMIRFRKELKTEK